MIWVSKKMRFIEDLVQHLDDFAWRLRVERILNDLTDFLQEHPVAALIAVVVIVVLAAGAFDQGRSGKTRRRAPRDTRTPR